MPILIWTSFALFQSWRTCPEGYRITCLSSPLLKWSHTLVDPTSLYNDLEKGSKENLRTLYICTENTKRCAMSKNNETNLLVKVNSSMITFMDHSWSIPFHDKHIQCDLLYCIITFCVWAWFLVWSGKTCQSLQAILTCHTLKSSFNHGCISLNCCLAMLSIQFVHDLSSGFIPYVKVHNWVILSISHDWLSDFM